MLHDLSRVSPSVFRQGIDLGFVLPSGTAIGHWVPGDWRSAGQRPCKRQVGSLLRLTHLRAALLQASSRALFFLSCIPQTAVDALTSQQECASLQMLCLETDWYYWLNADIYSYLWCLEQQNLKSQQTADLNRARLKQMTTHKSAGFKCLTGGEEKNAVFEYQIFIGS